MTYIFNKQDLHCDDHFEAFSCEFNMGRNKNRKHVIIFADKSIFADVSDNVFSNISYRFPKFTKENNSIVDVKLNDAMKLEGTNVLDYPYVNSQQKLIKSITLKDWRIK
jgi:hypothetical protein